MKTTFIPKAYRPSVPGSKLKNLIASSLPGIYTNDYLLKNNHSPNVCIISSKDDIVPHHFLNEIDSPGEVYHLYYDDLGVEWDFSFSEGILKLYLKDSAIQPTAIYHRHPGISKDHPYYHKHIAFFEIIDIWKGNLIGQKRDHYHNSSKAYQGIMSISRAVKSVKNKMVKYPRSFFLKGDMNLLRSRIASALIVKSCSSIRSKVVSNEIFDKWNIESIKYLPTLFQEKIDGVDIRVHVCDDTFWALEVESKDCIDYRYASKGTIKYREVPLPKEIKNFCKSIAQYENNQLIGVDLMKSENAYFCLESNPGPGWSTFNHPSKTKFANTVFSKLLRRQL